MFENLIEQKTVDFLIDDINNNKLPPSLLFAGESFSGKLTAALETARVLSCKSAAHWNCSCDSCMRHKELLSSDLLLIGMRDHIPEIKAAGKTLKANRTIHGRYLFLRSIRKLTLRFDARLWDDDDSRFLKAAPVISEIEDLLSSFTTDSVQNIDEKELDKTITSLIAKAEKLQDECMYDTIPISQVRKASSWIRLMPAGRKKVLIVENADKMQDSVRNAFLKILEEPPAYSCFILTTTQKRAIMPTILSRVRTYNFYKRSADAYNQIIKRVFRDIPDEEEVFGFSKLHTYLYSFLPVTFKTIQNAAALFYKYIFSLTTSSANANELQQIVYNHINGNNLEKESCSVQSIVKQLNNCKPSTVYILFLNGVLSFLEKSLRTCKPGNMEIQKYFMITIAIRNAEEHVNIFNISVQAALENLAYKIMEIIQ